jgi:hypothetical protein
MFDSVGVVTSIDDFDVLSKSQHPKWGKLHLPKEISKKNPDPGISASPGGLPSKE